jgi:predicted nucleotidyltransferase
MTIEQSQHLHQLNALAASHPEVAVLWLYGSQAKGNASEHSDWDLAVALDPVKAERCLILVLELNCLLWIGKEHWG